jgi:hypothetical protein
MEPQHKHSPEVIAEALRRLEESGSVFFDGRIISDPEELTLAMGGEPPKPEGEESNGESEPEAPDVEAPAEPPAPAKEPKAK